MGAHGVSSEHVENMEMFSGFPLRCSPVLQVRCALVNKDIHCMFVEGNSRTVFFPSDTCIYGISRDGSANYNIRTCEHMILGQLQMGARQTNYAPLVIL